MTNKEYREHEGIARSELFLINKSPLHFKHSIDNPSEETAPTLIFGSAAHKYILEKDDFYNEFATMIKVDRRTKEGKAQYAKFQSENEGKTIISDEDLEKIKGMYEAIQSNAIAKEILYNPKAEYEQSFFWVDSTTGEAVKCRPDCITEYNGKKYIVDYKTTTSCANGEFERSVRKYGYKLQAGMYREGVFLNRLDDYGFIFIAQEKDAPYAVRIYICTEDFINEGYDQYRELLGIYHYCKENDLWYGYEGAMNETSSLTGEGETL